MTFTLCALPAVSFGASGAARDTGASSKGGFSDFDPSMLSGGSRHAIDLSRFEKGDVVLPGIYNLDVFLNRSWIGRFNVRFAAPKAGSNARPCITPQMMKRLGLKSRHDVAGFGQPGSCVQIEDLISGARSHFDQADLRLDVSVPQAYLDQLPRGYVNPASWDQGVTAGILNYNLDTYRTDNNGTAQTSTYLGLAAGLNLGPWHLRQQSTATWQSAYNGTAARHRWTTIAAYAQRDLPTLRSKLTLGDSYTDGTVFDTLGLRGVQLGTDDRMLPQSLRGYAPVIHGVAETNAKVTITQNGVQIYQTTVSPGPFTIRDLYPTGYGGNLLVTVTEANGHTHGFTVPYASVSQLLRAGTTRYDVAVGRLRNLSESAQPSVVQATVQHGFSNLFTGYAGVQGSRGYAAILLGGAFNTRAGAVALDVTQDRASIPGYRPLHGQSLRLSYSKVIPDSLTALTVAAYRYSSNGFLSIQDAVHARDYAKRGLDLTQYLPTQPTTVNGMPLNTTLTPAQQALLSGSTIGYNPGEAVAGIVRRRNRLTLTLNQRLGDRAGSIYANASFNDYWQRSGTDKQFQFGYNNVFRRLSYNLSATRTRGPLGHYDNRFFVSLSVPLGDSSYAPSFTLNSNHDDQTGSRQQAMLNGSLGADNQFTYGVTATHAGGSVGDAGSANGTYRSPYAVFGASYGKGSGYSQVSMNLSGAVVAHRGGVTFGQPTGDTIGIVHAPGAEGARVTNAPGVRVDGSGYALVPYMNPYQLNTIRLDPQGASLGVQLDSTSDRVAPYAGAVVMLNFKTRHGSALIVRIHLADGQPAPFGTEVDDARGDALGVVGQAGLALLRVKQDSGQLNARWSDAQGSAHTCHFDYALPPRAAGPSAHPVIDVRCDAHPPMPSSEGKT